MREGDVVASSPDQMHMKVAEGWTVRIGADELHDGTGAVLTHEWLDPMYDVRRRYPSAFMKELHIVLWRTQRQEDGQYRAIEKVLEGYLAAEREADRRFERLTFDPIAATGEYVVREPVDK